MRLAAAEESAMVQSLLCVLAQLLHRDQQQLLDCLAGIRLRWVVLGRWLLAGGCSGGGGNRCQTKRQALCCAGVPACMQLPAWLPACPGFLVAYCSQPHPPAPWPLLPLPWPPLLCSDGRSALEVAMQKWCERQIEVRTPYDIKLTTTALAGLLVAPHPALDAIQVGGWVGGHAGACFLPAVLGWAGLGWYEFQRCWGWAAGCGRAGLGWAASSGGQGSLALSICTIEAGCTAALCCAVLCR